MSVPERKVMPSPSSTCALSNAAKPPATMKIRYARQNAQDDSNSMRRRPNRSEKYPEGTSSVTIVA